MFQKTGAVSIQTTPKSVQIFLNQKQYSDSSGIFQGTTLISNILPQKYNLVIKKDGYFDYQKNIEVFPSQVTRILNVLLVPTKITDPQILSSTKGNAIEDVSQDGRIITLDTAKNNFYIYDLNSASTNTNLTSQTSFLKQKISDIKFYPQENTKYVVKTAKGLYSIDTDSQDFSQIKSGNIYSFSVFENNLIYISPTPQATSTKATSTKSQIVIYDLTLNSQARVQILPFDGSLTKDIQSSGNYITTRLSNGSLWLYNTSDGSFTQIAHSTKDASFSPDGRKLFYQDSDGKSFAYLFNDEIVDLDSIKGNAIRLNFVDASKTEKIWWFSDSFHFILQYPSDIYIAELTKSEPNNRFRLIPKTGTIYYDSQKDIVYNLSTSTLSVWNLNLK